MREMVILGILLLNLIVQSSIFPFIEIFHVKPDSLLTLVVSFALVAGNPTGALVGFCGGLLQDLFFGNNLGLYALQYMIVGYLAGLLHGRLYVDKVFIPMLAIIPTNLLKQTVMLVYNFFSQSGMFQDRMFIQILIFETIYTIVLMPFVFSSIVKLYDNKFMRKKRHFPKIR
ncbi:MAG: rod shape-determining protein MreD [Caldicoprobacterales bacterium]|jgi:rod shape-determining protein MreD|nr:rod shape-determining protein MreD [Clostridiales bacterium]